MTNESSSSRLRGPNSAPHRNSILVRPSLPPYLLLLNAQMRTGIAVFLDPTLNPKCTECESIDIDHTFKRVFGLLVCEKCKAEKPEKYSLLTKTECKEVSRSLPLLPLLFLAHLDLDLERRIIF